MVESEKKDIAHGRTGQQGKMKVNWRVDPLTTARDRTTVLISWLIGVEPAVSTHRPGR